MPKPQLHWSMLSMLQRCPVQFDWRYVKGVKKPPAVAIVIGKSTHHGIDLNLTHKIKTGELLPVDEVTERVAETVNSDFAEGVALDEEEKTVGESKVRGEAVDTAVALSRLHHAELAPKIKPKHVERKWVLELKGFPVDLAGTIDIQTHDDTVRDTKTAARSPQAGAADDSDQLTVYSLAASTLDGIKPILFLDSLVKTKTPKVVTQMTVRGKSDYEVLLARIAAASRVIETGAFMPCAQDSFWCSERYCGYALECPYFRKKVQVPT